MPDMLSNGSEEAVATALDEVLTALQSGKPINRADILARHPILAGAVDVLDRLLPSRTPTIPEWIGPYQVKRELGAGGFGIVYLAFDPDLKRDVAIKILHGIRLEQPEAVGRFQLEARATGKLRHPGIVQLFDYSRQGPPYYLVTEYINGLDPRVWCRQRLLKPSAIAELVALIADAIDYAHQNRVYHRDLKPGNILVDAAGQPHVLDFGLARLEANEGTTLPFETREGNILGSLPYMPPEQATGHGHTADARSDVYSLGVILYELLTGGLPFQGPAHNMPARVVEELPMPLRPSNPLVSRALEAVCLKALAKLPSERYATAAELAADLRAAAEGRRVSAEELTAWTVLRRVLNRRHLETLRSGWTPLLLMLGLTIFLGCVLCNQWQWSLDAKSVWPAILVTKVVQVAVMLVMVVRWRPTEDVDTLGRAAPCKGPPALSNAERQIWSIVPGYYGGFLTLLVLNWGLELNIPLGPVLAILSGVGFTMLGGTIWGWFFVWGVIFFALAILAACFPVYGLTILGVGWLFCLVGGSIHLHLTR